MPISSASMPALSQVTCKTKAVSLVAADILSSPHCCLSRPCGHAESETLAAPVLISIRERRACGAVLAFARSFLTLTEGRDPAWRKPQDSVTECVGRVCQVLPCPCNGERPGLAQAKRFRDGMCGAGAFRLALLTVGSSPLPRRAPDKTCCEARCNPCTLSPI